MSADGKMALSATPLQDDVRIVPELDAAPRTAHLPGRSELPGKSGLPEASPPPVIHVFSESGIGGAELRFAGEAIPYGFTLRLHLAGLEALTLNCDGVEVRASVQSYGEPVVRQAIVGPDGRDETALMPGNDSWASITSIYGEQAGVDDSRPVYYDVELPPAFTVAGCGLLRVDWVDFFR